MQSNWPIDLKLWHIPKNFIIIYCADSSASYSVCCVEKEFSDHYNDVSPEGCRFPHDLQAQTMIGLTNNDKKKEMQLN